MYDFILKDGLVVDGTGKSPYKASVAIKEEVISEIAEHIDTTGSHVIDCNGKIISPGFIDLHTHSDSVSLNSINAVSMLNQGVTTLIAGNSEKLLFSSNQSNLPINTGILIGHGELRASVIGFEDRKATLDELEKMKSILDREMKNGVFGMSLGLIYPPSNLESMDELKELGKVIKDNGGILTVHMQNEDDGIFDSVNEMIEIAEETGVHLHISHLRLIGKPQWDRYSEFLDYIELAKERGCNITYDQYSYEAIATSLAALIPRWALDGGIDKIFERLERRELRLLQDIYNLIEKSGGPEKVVISTTHGYFPEFDGKSIEEISDILNLSPVETVIELLLQCNGEVSAFYFPSYQDDILKVNHNPLSRCFGTFSSYLQMVRENEILSIENAIYKITGLPSKILNLPNRGIIKEGYKADLTVFDLESSLKPKGIYHVFVAGLPALYNGEQTINRNGRIIAKSY